MISGRFGLLSILMLMGAGWGLTQPLSRIAVSTGYRQFGLIFWQLIVSALVLGTVILVLALTGRRHWHKPAWPSLAACLTVALLGTLIPNGTFYRSIVHLPAGLMAILISLVPIMAFPLALLFRVEEFGWLRLAGLGLGLSAIVLIALPQSSLPDPALAAFIPVALIGPLCYALEGVAVARWGKAGRLGGLDPLDLLFGASILGAIIAAPLAWSFGQWINPLVIWHGPEWALLASSLLHTFAYVTYVWMVGRAGAVFSLQVGYLVTGWGILWSMLLLGERYSGWIWLALGLIVIGIALVRPRQVDGRGNDFS